MTFSKFQTRFAYAQNWEFSPFGSLYFVCFRRVLIKGRLQALLNVCCVHHKNVISTTQTAYLHSLQFHLRSSDSNWLSASLVSAHVFCSFAIAHSHHLEHSFRTSAYKGCRKRVISERTDVVLKGCADQSLTTLCTCEARSSRRHALLQQQRFTQQKTLLFTVIGVWKNRRSSFNCVLNCSFFAIIYVFFRSGLSAKYPKMLSTDFILAKKVCLCSALKCFWTGSGLLNYKFLHLVSN